MKMEKKDGRNKYGKREKGRSNSRQAAGCEKGRRKVGQVKQKK